MNKELRYASTATPEPNYTESFTNKSTIIVLFVQMTLWSMAKSPLMFGGDVRNLDDTTFSLITNPTLLEINSFSSNNKEASEQAYSL